MKKAIAFVTILCLCIAIILGADKKNTVNYVKITISDTMPKATDTSYAQKQSAYYADTGRVLNEDTIRANAVFVKMDSVKYTRQGNKSKPHPAK